MSKKTVKEEAKKAEVKALKTPVVLAAGTLAKGGKAIIDMKTAEHKEKSGDVVIIRVL